MATQGRRRALGQHFLKDKSVCNRIADRALELLRERPCLALLEVGPGKGALTLPLLERISGLSPAPEVILAERDRGLAERWRSDPRVRVEEGDFVEAAKDRWLSRAPLGVVSNLPYSAGTAILVKLARHPEELAFMVLMFQAEVARKLRAEPGSREWGSLSVWIRNRWDVARLLSVPPRAFSPPPDVDSEVVTLLPRTQPQVEVPGTPEGEKLWETLLRVAFAHRRKMLRSGLPGSGPWRNALEQSGVDGTKRAEALSWDEWRKLHEAVRRLSAGA